MPNSCVQNSLAADWKENKFNFLTHSHERSGGMIFLLCLNIKTSLWLMLLLDCDNTGHKKGINLTTKTIYHHLTSQSNILSFSLEGQKVGLLSNEQKDFKTIEDLLGKKSFAIQEDLLWFCELIPYSRDINLFRKSGQVLGTEVAGPGEVKHKAIFQLPVPISFCSG